MGRHPGRVPGRRAKSGARSCWKPPRTPATSCWNASSKARTSPRRCCARPCGSARSSGKLTPVLCGSAKEYHGVRLLLDAVRDYLPSPADRPPVAGLRAQVEGQGARRAQARRRPSRSRPWPSRPSARSTATWCSCASTPASCSPATRCMNSSHQASPNASATFTGCSATAATGWKWPAPARSSPSSA